MCFKYDLKCVCGVCGLVAFVIVHKRAWFHEHSVVLIRYIVKGAIIIIIITRHVQLRTNTEHSEYIYVGMFYRWPE